MKALARITAAFLLTAGLLLPAGCGTTAGNPRTPARWSASSTGRGPAFVSPALVKQLDGDLDWILSRRKGSAPVDGKGPGSIRKGEGERVTD